LTDQRKATSSPDAPSVILRSAQDDNTVDDGTEDDSIVPGIATRPPIYRGTSFIQTDCMHVIVETIKPAEDGKGLIVRLYEAHNQRGHGMLTFATSILSAQECNLLEEPINDVSYHGNTLSFQVRPFEIKTFRVHLALER
jgi:hypothetical protein